MTTMYFDNIFDLLKPYTYIMYILLLYKQYFTQTKLNTFFNSKTILYKTRKR